MMSKPSILKFLQTHKLGVVSTIDSKQNAPESALVAFVVDDAFRLYFQTKSTTRKASNLLSNPKVSLVIGTDLEEMVTLQYEGLAKTVTSSEQIHEIKERFIKNQSPASKFLDHPEVIFFQVTPLWIGFSDYTNVRPAITELTDF